MNNASQIKILAFLIVSVFALGAVSICTVEADATEENKANLIGELQTAFNGINDVAIATIDNEGNISVMFKTDDDGDLNVTQIMAGAEALFTALMTIGDEPGTSQLTILGEDYTLSDMSSTDKILELAHAVLGSGGLTSFINEGTLKENYTASIKYNGADVELNATVSFFANAEAALIGELQTAFNGINDVAIATIDNEGNISVMFKTDDDGDLNVTQIMAGAEALFTALMTIGDDPGTSQLTILREDYTLSDMSSTDKILELAHAVLGSGGLTSFINEGTLKENYTASIKYNGADVELNATVSFFANAEAALIGELQTAFNGINDVAIATIDNEGNISVMFKTDDDGDLNVTQIMAGAEALFTALMNIGDDPGTSQLTILREDYTLSDMSSTDKILELAHAVLGSGGLTSFINEGTLKENYTASIKYNGAEVSLEANVAFSIGYTITFNDGITVKDADNKLITSGDFVVHGTELTLSIEEKDGYTLKVLAGEDVIISEGNFTADYIVTGEVEFTLEETINTYTITWNVDGTEETTEVVDYGTDNVNAYSATDVPGHTFSGWFADEAMENEATFPATVTGDTTYYAEWEINQYTVTFNNEEITVKEGAAVVNSGATIAYETELTVTPIDKTGYTSALTATSGTIGTEGTYTVTSDVTFNNTYTVNQYTITFNSDGGSDVASITADFGATITAPAEPTKTGYTFDGWDTEIPGTMPAENITVTAQWTINQYTITFVSDGGSDVASIEADFGATITAPAEPTKTGYTFDGWDTEIPETMPAENITVTAQWTINQYTIKWTVNEETVKTEELAYNSPLTTPGSDFETAQYTYTDVTWGEIESLVTGDVTYTAISHEKTVNQYTIKFNYGDVTYDEQELDYGLTIVAPHKLGKAPTVGYEYTFEWVGYEDDVTVTGDETFIGEFTEIARMYTITWIVDGTETTAQVAYDDTPVFDGTPTKDATAEFTYSFDEWTPDVVDVTGDAEYTATFTSVTNVYTITWTVDGGETDKTETLPYGATPDYGEAPVTDQYTYTITGWDSDIAVVTGDATYTATFDKETNEYTITWIVDGIETTAQVAYGDTPAFDGTPTKDEDAQFTYEFTVWDPSVETVTGPATYTAQFSETLRQYTITYYNLSEELFVGDYELGYGESIPRKDDLSKASTDQYDYTFEWVGYEDGMTVTGDKTFNGVFTEVLRSYTVIFNDGDTNVYEEDLEYGTDIVAPTEIPTKGSTVQYEYTFNEWTGYTDDMTVEGDVTFNADFTETTRSYTVIFKNGETNVYEEVLGYGTTIDAPTGTPTKESTVQYEYTFNEWTGYTVGMTVEGDVTFNADFTETIREYTITYVSEGLSVEDYELGYGEPIPRRDNLSKTPTVQYEYTFEWVGYTDGMIVTGDVTFDGVFTEVLRSYTVIFNDGDTNVYEKDLEYGTDIVAPTEIPTKGSTDQYEYTFNEWTGYTDDMTVEGDVTFNADFTETTRSYTVIFNDGDTNVYEEVLGYGTDIVAPTEIPTKESTVQYEYTFNEWTGYTVGMTVEGDVTFNADFAETTRQYTITYLEGVHEVDEYELGYGEPIPRKDDLSKASTVQYDYTFEWVGYEDGMTVTGDKTFNGVFTEVLRSYTIEWKIADFTGTTEVAYDETPEYGPTVIADEITYTNVVWETDPVPVTGPATYTASTYDASPSVYTITFKFGDITFKEQYLNYDDTIVAPEELSRDSTPEFDYTFEWVDYTDGMTVTGDKTFIGEFTEVTREYTITWIVDGTETTTQVAYGETPAFDGTPTKDATAEFTYSFDEWTPDVVDVTGDAEYTATFTSVTNVYTITWTVDGGETDKTETLPYGATPDYGEAPVTDQYTYTITGWDSDIAVVTGDATYTATFDKETNEYTITWIVDGIETTAQVAYGETPTFDGTPTKDATAEFTYSFDVWTPDVVNVTGDAEYTATFTSVTNEYTVAYKMEIGGVYYTIQSEELAYGTPITLMDDLVKDPIAQYEYTFEWAGYEDGMTVTGDKTFYGVFTQVLREYTITWMVDGTETTTQVAYGETPVFDGTPTKDATTEFTYEFTVWDPSVETVTGPATYTAQFESTEIVYHDITWIVDGLDDVTEQVAEGEMPSYGDDPVKADDLENTYEFTGWDPVLAEAIENASYTAQFEATPITYTITWVVDGITPNYTTQVFYNDMPEYGDDPTKVADETYTYAFIGWDPELTEVIEDATYTAQFESTEIVYYDITWIVDGSETTTQVAEGEMPSYGDDPVKADDLENTYEFTGWDPVLAEAIENASYTAQFEATPITYTITWVVDGITPNYTTQVFYNDMPEYGDDPTKVADETYTYAFIGWDPELTEVIEDATYTAQFESTEIVYYDITWIVDGSETTTQVAEGEMPSYGDDPVKADDLENTYEFTGWDPVLAEAIENASYTAQFEATPITYTITWVVDGSQVDEVFNSGSTLEYTGEVPTKDATAEFTYEFVGWTPELAATVTGDATYTAQFESTEIVYYDITWIVDGLDDVTEQVAEGEMPSYGDDPVKADDIVNTYEFTGWDPVLAEATENASYTAQFEATPITYTITWVVSDLEDRVEQVAANVMPSYGDDPVKADDIVNTYEFTGWDPVLAEATENASYTAQFEATPIGYTMTWVVNGVETTTGPLGYGAAIIAPADPADYSNDRGNYTFVNWEGYVAGETTVEGDMTFEAVFDETLNTYTIVFKAGNITFKKVTLDYGADIIAPAKIKKASTPQYDYTFEWVGYTAGMTVTGDETFSGAFTEVLRSYTITWMIEGVGTTSTVNYGVVPVYEGETPTKEAVGEQTFTFDGWDVDPIAVTGPATYTAEFVEVPID